MSHRDIVDFSQVSVKFVEDEEAIKLLTNPMYRPILRILREGVKTAEEIEEEFKTRSEYKEVSGKTPSLKTIYRHLKALSNADLVIQAGVRILDRTDVDKPPVTQKLFARTAKFFYLSDKSKEALEPEKIQKRVDVLWQILSLDYKLEKSSKERLGDLITNSFTFGIEQSKRLFTEFPDELAEIAGHLPLNELQQVLDDYLTLKILLENTDLRKNLSKIILE